MDKNIKIDLDDINESKQSDLNKLLKDLNGKIIDSESTSIKADVLDKNNLVDEDELCDRINDNTGIYKGGSSNVGEPVLFDDSYELDAVDPTYNPGSPLPDTDTPGPTYNPDSPNPSNSDMLEESIDYSEPELSDEEDIIKNIKMDNFNSLKEQLDINDISSKREIVDKKYPFDEWNIIKTFFRDNSYYKLNIN